MPTPAYYGQTITFLLEDVTRVVWDDVAVTPSRNTVKKIAKAHKLSDRVREIADYNDIRSIVAPMKRKSIKVPRKRITRGNRLEVVAGDTPPTITGGYAKYDAVDRPDRVGLTRFLGYDPLTMDVPIRFENVIDGEGVPIERDIKLLERMAGRGVFEGAAVGRPGRVRVLTLDDRGQPMPLIPSNYQPHPDNPNPPTWVITDIEWDDSVPGGVLRNREGNRVRQLAVVTLMQHVSADPIPFHATDRRATTHRMFEPSWRFTRGR